MVITKNRMMVIMKIPVPVTLNTKMIPITKMIITEMTIITKKNTIMMRLSRKCYNHY